MNPHSALITQGRQIVDNGLPANPDPCAHGRRRPALRAAAAPRDCPPGGSPQINLRRSDGSIDEFAALARESKIEPRIGAVVGVVPSLL